MDTGEGDSIIPNNILHLVKKHLNKWKHSPAVIFDDGNTVTIVTYNQMLKTSSNISYILTQFGVKDKVVGVLVSTNQHLPSILCGILECNAAFYNFESKTMNMDFATDVVKRLCVEFVLVESEKLQEVEHLIGSFNGEVKREPYLTDINVIVLHLKGIKRQQENNTLAYCITTSGTTGNPKIVQVPHCCIIPNIVHLRKIYQMSQDDLVFLCSPLTFDPSIVEIFVTLSSGACLLIAPQDIKIVPHKLLNMLYYRHQVTVLQATPSFITRINFNELSRTLLGQTTKLRILALGGEKFPPLSNIRKWRSVKNKTRLINLYGVTEVSCWSSYYEVTDDDFSRQLPDIPLGQPLKGTNLIVLDENGQEVFDGEGQVFIDSAERICYVDEEDQHPSVSLVRRNSGDLVKIGPDKTLVFVCRIDKQVKRNGKRINTTELEQVVMTHTAVRNCAVLFEDTQLFVFVCQSENMSVTSLTENIEMMIRNSLPSHYWPDDVIHIKEVPITNHGKTDSKALMKLACKSVAERYGSLVEEKKIYELVQLLWKNVLKLDSLKDSENFLANGGDSLTAMQLSNKLETALGFKLPMLLEFILNKNFCDVFSYIEMCVIKFTAEENDEFCKMQMEIEHETEQKQRQAEKENVSSGRTNLPKHLKLKENNILPKKRKMIYTKRNSTSDLYNRNTERNNTFDLYDRNTEINNPSDLYDRNTEINSTSDLYDRNTEINNTSNLYDRNTEHAERNSTSDLYDRNTERNNTSDINDSVGQRSKHSKYLDLFCTDGFGLSSFSRCNQRFTCKDFNELNVSQQNTHNYNIAPKCTNICKCRFRDRFEVEKSSKYCFVQKDQVSSSLCQRTRVDMSNKERATTDTKINLSVCKTKRKLEPKAGDFSVTSTLTKNLNTEIKLCENRTKCRKAVVEAMELNSCQVVPMKVRDWKIECVEAWRHNTGKCVDASPLIVLNRIGQHIVYIGSHSHKVCAIVMETGQLLWETYLGGRIESSACVSLCGKFIIVGCYDSGIYSLCITSGKIQWVYRTQGHVKCSPAVDPVTSLVIFGSHDQIIYALNIEKHKCVWSRNLGNGSIFSSLYIHTDPHMAVVCTLMGTVLAICPVTGNDLWKFDCGKPVFSSPTFTKCGPCVGCVDGKLYQFSHQGQLIWVVQTEAPIFCSPACVHVTSNKKVNTDYTLDYRILIGSHDHHLYCIMPDGKLSWKFKTDSTVYSSGFGFRLPYSFHSSFCYDINSSRSQITSSEFRSEFLARSHEINNESYDSCHVTEHCVHNQGQHIDSCHISERCVHKQDSSHIGVHNQGQHIGSCHKNEHCVHNQGQHIGSFHISEHCVHNQGQHIGSCHKNEHCVHYQDSCCVSEQCVHYQGQHIDNCHISERCVHCQGRHTDELCLNGNEKSVSTCKTCNDRTDKQNCDYVVCTSTKGTLYILQVTTGELLTSFCLLGEVFSSPVVVNQHIVFGCRDDFVYCFKIKNLH